MALLRFCDIKMKKHSYTLLASLVLSACGGGGADSEKETDVPSDTTPSKTYVSGNTVQSGSAGYIEYPTEDVGQGYYCNGSSDKYFESEFVRVYANSAVGNNDLMAVATIVQNNMSFSYGKMNFTTASLKEFMPQYAPTIANRFLQTNEYNDELAYNYVYTGIHKDLDWKSMTASDVIYGIPDHYQSLDTQGAIDTALILTEKFSELSGTEVEKRSDKVIVCLAGHMNKSRFAEGTFRGLNFAEPETDSRVLESVYTKHELIHHVQMQHYRVTDGSVIGIYNLPYWLVEGQAVYLSGQSIAKRSEVSNTSIDDMNNASDKNLYYEEYGLAYSYLHLNNDIDTINKLYSNTASGITSFESAFDALGLKNHYGQVMTYSSFKSNYQTWVADWK
ncbi:hypothetical protein SHLI107390_11145 [Shewanella livingstonensis]|uniref:Uncharacterized protein n=2 Tax=Shewanella livingstonensis TaxID=150120 RepID=A0A3G8LWT9_9GAMM|nr:hypothetical protein [Shewanella livingstonensis]AZG74126.1 hypothetical protein EGC82_16015 [Shewanella livingstonensis]